MDDYENALSMNNKYMHSTITIHQIKITLCSQYLVCSKPVAYEQSKASWHLSVIVCIFLPVWLYSVNRFAMNLETNYMRF